MDGRFVGIADGDLLGDRDGLDVGLLDGCSDVDGYSLGISVGDDVGTVVGDIDSEGGNEGMTEIDGMVEFCTEGNAVGSIVGATVGMDEFITEGMDEFITDGLGECIIEGMDEFITDGLGECIMEGLDELIKEGYNDGIVVGRTVDFLVGAFVDMGSIFVLVVFFLVGALVCSAGSVKFVLNISNDFVLNISFELVDADCFLSDMVGDRFDRYLVGVTVDFDVGVDCIILSGRILDGEFVLLIFAKSVERQNVSVFAMLKYFNEYVFYIKFVTISV